ncbi:hypothetical protein [Arthrobacter burdickii]|uniref:Integral membrane protein n=1 Tax=Arthrobacter burdickii TaxID=3035920 RepID=A0ABT8JWL2_9MICC|nr:hypothetical protein [Arthrobacter burdickii]MDN4609563.1 hypothetical protein [Arthrobacter burdickii]
MIEIGGLPAHILLIHAVVVLAPIAGLLAVLFAVVPRLRGRLAWPLGALAVLLAPLSLLTAQAGEQLERSMPESALIEAHAEQGDLFKALALVFLVAVAAQLLAAFPQALIRTQRLNGLRRLLDTRWVRAVAVVLGVIGGLVITYQSIVTGHSGSASVWSG